MTVYSKPEVTPAWAEDNVGVVANMIKPADADIKAGWPLSAIPPPRQRWNWVLNYVANGLRYLMQRGLSDWDAAENYVIGSRVNGPDGLTYRSLQATNIANNPSSSPAFWERWGFSMAELDARFTARDFKESCRIASTANIAALTGLSVIDGVTPVVGDRILLKDQSTASQNGVYVAAAGAWSRAVDFVTGTASSGACVAVTEGTVNGDTLWLLATNDPITIGTTPLTFVSVRGISQTDADLRYASIKNVAAPVRQTILAGASAFISIGAGLACGILGATTPLRLTFPAGYDDGGQVDYYGNVSTNPAAFWSGLAANVVNYLFVDRNPTTGVLTGVSSTVPYDALPSSNTPSIVAGAHTYHIDTGIMYVGNGSAATPVQRVAVGECLAGASTITSVTSYAKQGRFYTVDGNAPSTVRVEVPHNLGVKPREYSASILLSAAQLGYVLGTEIPMAHIFNSSQAAVCTVSVDRNTIGVISNTGGLYTYAKTTGTFTALSTTDVDTAFRVDRGF